MATSRKFFLVACPRSGTTLLQCILAAHSSIASFPESHFFPRLLPRERWRRFLGIANREINDYFAGYAQLIGDPQPPEWPATPQRRAVPYVRAFVRILDRLTRDQGKRYWLEKTPGHLLYVEQIRRLVPDARFIHILRNGRDVVASLYEVTRAYPEVWGGERTIDECLDRWIGDVRTTSRYLGHGDHIVVRFEELVEDPRAVVQNLCVFMEVDFEENMLTEYSSVSGRVVPPEEMWKKGAAEGIQAPQSKFEKVFDEAEREYVDRRLSDARLDRGVVQLDLP